MTSVKYRTLTIISVVSLVLAIFSTILPIFSYTTSLGRTYTYNILNLIWPADDGLALMKSEYIGKAIFEVEAEQVLILALIGIVALVFAGIGLAILSQQKRNIPSFILMLFGLIGTMIPSIFIFYLSMGKKYSGIFSAGIYPYVGILSMLVCIVCCCMMFRRAQSIPKGTDHGEDLLFRSPDLM